MTHHGSKTSAVGLLIVFSPGMVLPNWRLRHLFLEVGYLSLASQQRRPQKACHLGLGEQGFR